MSDEKIKRTLRQYLLRSHPGEELRGCAFALERLNSWLEFILLGPIAGAVGTRSYYFGLTDKRIVLVALSSWTSQPTENVSEIPLGRIKGIEYKKGWLTSNLNVHYGENIKRKLTFNWRQRQNAKKIVDVFESLPKPVLSDEEIRAAMIGESIYKDKAYRRVWQAFAVLGLLLFLMFLCSLA